MKDLTIPAGVLSFWFGVLFGTLIATSICLWIFLSPVWFLIALWTVIFYVIGWTAT